MSQRTKILQIFTTGGTIDKVYFDDKSRFEVGEPQIAEVLQEANLGIDYMVTPLMRKDSLELSDTDRNYILKAVLESECSQIVITHGTDTMIDTAKMLDQVPDKTIVLTGSMQPARFRHTDAVFNIASAIMSVQILHPGVYIILNGRVFDPNNVRKNRKLNRFEEL